MSASAGPRGSRSEWCGDRGAADRLVVAGAAGSADQLPFSVSQLCGRRRQRCDDSVPECVVGRGTVWRRFDAPGRRPHEYVRGGTSKLLTLCRPATGEVCAEAVERATNAVLHHWLKRELTTILAACCTHPSTTTRHRPSSTGRSTRWTTRGTSTPRRTGCTASSAPFRLISGRRCIAHSAVSNSLELPRNPRVAEV